MAEIINSKITPQVNVEDALAEELENFRKLTKGSQQIKVPKLIIDMNHLRNLIETNPGVPAIEVFLVLDSSATVGVFFQPTMLGKGIGPGSGQGVKVP